MKVSSFVMVFYGLALVLCVLCRDVVVGCGRLLRSVCCRLLLKAVSTFHGRFFWLNADETRKSEYAALCEPYND